MSMASYSEYRTTGDAWLVAIPKQWTLAKCGHHYEVLLGKMLDAARVTGRNSGRYLRNVDVQWDRISEDDLPEMDFAPLEVARYSVRKGDLVVCEGGEPGRCAIWDRAYTCFYQKALHRLRPRKSASDLPRYMFYNLAVAVAQARFEAGGGKATIAHLPAETLRQERFPFPPLDEQTQIARFLDYETARIDALIEKQQQLIALLNEKRQAVISHAVTKGLNPNAPLRDSGVEWLGTVPAHWEVCRVKQATSFITSGPHGWSDLITDEGADIFLQSGDLNDTLGLRLKTAKRISPPQNAEGIRTRMQPGDVVVCITGANTGRVAVADELPANVYVNQHLSLVRPKARRVVPRFLATILSASALKSYFAVAQYGLKEGLSLTNVGEAPIALPPLEEQRIIVEALVVREELMNALEMAATAQIDLLQERRTALISAAVTGKIDVRGWQPPESKVENAVA